jgi:hypothetical protein
VICHRVNLKSHCNASYLEISIIMVCTIHERVCEKALVIPDELRMWLIWDGSELGGGELRSCVILVVKADWIRVARIKRENASVQRGCHVLSSHAGVMYGCPSASKTGCTSRAT